MWSGICRKVVGIFPLRFLRRALSQLGQVFLYAGWHKRKDYGLSKRIRIGGIDMSEMAMLEGAEPRTILKKLMEKKIPAIMSYLSKGKWHVAKVQLIELGACRLTAELLPAKKPHPINIRPEQPVGLALKYGYGKFIFETKVVSLEPSPQGTSGGVIILEMPDRIELVQRRAFFRVEVPKSLRVSTLLWYRRQQDDATAGIEDGSEAAGKEQTPPARYWQGRLVDISAGGAQIAVDYEQGGDFKVGQFIGVRFTPLPYERPLMFNAQIRSVLPTADGESICLGLQIVGLEASPEGRQVLSRLVSVVERYYQMNQSSLKEQDFQKTGSAL